MKAKHCLALIVSCVALSGCSQMSEFNQKLENWAGEMIKIRDGNKQDVSTSYGETSTQTVDDNTPVTLQGNIKMKKFISENTGKSVTVPVLSLKNPINFNDTEFGASASNVSEMQSFMENDSKQKLPKSGCIIASGELFSAITAHHYTPVMFTIKSFKSCK